MEIIILCKNIRKKIKVIFHKSMDQLTDCMIMGRFKYLNNICNKILKEGHKFKRSIMIEIKTLEMKWSRSGHM